MEKNSKISQFYKKTHSQRLLIVKKFADLSDQEINILKGLNSLSFNTANRMVENVISTMQLPLGIATNFLINNKNYLIPMAIEEPSVIAAASNAAKITRESGGFIATSSEQLMIGQIQLTQIKNIQKTIQIIKKNKFEIINLANKHDVILIALGGGAKNLTITQLKTSRGKMVIVNLIIDVKNAMGANIVNTMTEKIAPFLEKLTNSNSCLKIISNLPIYRIAKAKAIWKKESLSKDIIEKILDAYEFALSDPFRCVTHNKGIMNGIDAVAIATGNDFRAIEAGAHAYAAHKKNYRPLTKYYKNKNEDLVGEIELPIAAGIVGGITNSHPTAKICLKILGVKTAAEFIQILATVGLAQNFAALKALVTTGIQKGHMKLHSKNIAISAGAKNKKIDLISKQMCNENNISVNRAKDLLKIYEKTK